jgi:hypothetical protein
MLRLWPLLPLAAAVATGTEAKGSRACDTRELSVQTQRAMAAPQLAAQLGGAAAEREAAYTELFRLEAAHYELASSPKSRRRREIADIAVACTIPLCGVLTRPVVEVGVEEYHRAAQLLVALSGVDPGRVGGETIRPGIPPAERLWTEDTCGFRAVAGSPGSALGVVRAKKDLQTLTPEDALTVGETRTPPTSCLACIRVAIRSAF